MTESEQFIAHKELPVVEKAGYNINHGLSTQEIASLQIDPITAISVKSPHAEFSAAVKLNQYSAGPYEVALYPTHRKVSTVTELSKEEGTELFTTAYDIGTAFQKTAGEDEEVFIGLNQHVDVVNSPVKIQRENDAVPARVQTIDQLHMHVMCEPVSQSHEKSWNELTKEQQRELVDPYMPVMSDLFQPQIDTQALGSDVFGDTNIQYNKYPLGLNVELKSGLKTLKDPEFFESFVNLHSEYTSLYENLASLYVNKEQLDQYGAPIPLPKEERTSKVKEFIEAHPELSDYSKRLLETTANNIKPYEDEPWYNTFVLNPAYTVSIYGTKDHASLNWQPRIISRGNLLSSFGEYRTSRIPATDRKLDWIHNTYNSVYNHMAQDQEHGWHVERGGFLEGNWHPKLDRGISEKAIEYAKKELHHYDNPEDEEQLLRTYLEGKLGEDNHLATEPSQNEQGHIDIETALIKQKEIRNAYPIFDKEVTYKKGDEAISVSATAQEENFRKFIDQRKIENPEQWNLGSENINEEASRENKEIITNEGEVIYSEENERKRIDQFGERLKTLLAENNIDTQAYFGRPKATDSILYLLRSQHKNTHVLSDIDDLVGTSLVVEDFQSLENTMQLIEQTYGEKVLKKTNLFAEPFQQDPLYRGCFYYLAQPDNQIVELQVLPKTSALLDAAGYPLVFKPKVDLFREPLVELLGKAPEEVTSEDLTMVAKEPYNSITKRLLESEWKKYLKKD